ncbi:hypothetical protein PWG15_23735 (plasmid) [Ensifer adhaerens]|uniref:hypothetical protein n=1 Tax=Ensifer adhaerens TaxID=106592 RepID=UPI0023A9DDF7|nr:hypothetical protein [Ensifer adhaerens]WDZ80775.1 hypothetical protein PWG15_23735 [Ensifer adhaerens]
MQSEEHIAKAASTDPVKRWMKLMAEWNALTAELKEVRRAIATSTDEDHAALIRAEAALVTRGQSLKEEIDAALGEAASQRQPVNGPLIVGTLISPSKGDL